MEIEKICNIWGKEKEKLMPYLHGLTNATAEEMTLKEILEVKVKTRQTMAILNKLSANEVFDIKSLIDRIVKKMYRLKFIKSQGEGWKEKEKNYNTKYYSQHKCSEAEHFECPCGASYSHFTKGKHFHSKKHLEYLEVTNII